MQESKPEQVRLLKDYHKTLRAAYESYVTEKSQSITSALESKFNKKKLIYFLIER